MISNCKRDVFELILYGRLPSRPVPTTHGAYGALYHAQVENREMAQD